MSAGTDIFGTAYEVVTSGLAGIGLIAFFNRWIVPGASLTEMREERDEWKTLYEKEQQAHQATRDAFTAASQRADASVEAGRVALALVESMQRQARRSLDPGTASSPGDG